MKVFSKAELVRDQQMYRSMWVERRTMAEAGNRFVARISHTMQDENSCYLIMDSYEGGSLRRYLVQKGYMHEKRAAYYLAQVILGLERLHKLKIVYRSLRPDNIILDESGNAHLINFGDSARPHHKDDHMLIGKVGPVQYQAPEMIEGKSYDYSVDFWALGILMVELLTRKTPFDPDKPGYNPCTDKVKMVKQENRDFTPQCVQLISKLLAKDPERRLGRGCSGFKDLKKHKFFRKIDWKAMKRGETDAPYEPKMEKLRQEEALTALKKQRVDDGTSLNVEERFQSLFAQWEMSVPQKDKDGASAPPNTEVTEVANGPRFEPEQFPSYRRASFSNLSLKDADLGAGSDDEAAYTPSENEEYYANTVELVDRALVAN